MLESLLKKSIEKVLKIFLQTEDYMYDCHPLLERQKWNMIV